MIDLTIGIIAQGNEKYYYVEDYDSMDLWNALRYLMPHMAQYTIVSEIKKFNGRYSIIKDNYLFTSFSDAQNFIDWIEQEIVMRQLVLSNQKVAGL